MFKKFRFKVKVCNVLEDNFQYKVGGIQMPVLVGICKQSQLMGGNEYDAAIFFMMVQLNTLIENGMSIGNISQRTMDFVDLHTKNAFAVIHSSSRPYSEVMEFLNDVRSKCGLSKLS